MARCDLAQSLVRGFITIYEALSKGFIVECDCTKACCIDEGINLCDRATFQHRDLLSPYSGHKHHVAQGCGAGGKADIPVLN